MIITEAYARRLINQGRARDIGQTAADAQGRYYVIVDRLDLCRTDHYEGSDRGPTR